MGRAWTLTEDRERLCVEREPAECGPGRWWCGRYRERALSAGERGGGVGAAEAARSRAQRCNAASGARPAQGPRPHVTLALAAGNSCANKLSRCSAAVWLHVPDVQSGRYAWLDGAQKER
jgi:hypothetical protein